MAYVFFQTIILLFLLSCENPDGSGTLPQNSIGNNVSDSPNVAGRLNRQMLGPTDGHCPDCTEQDANLTRARSSGEFSTYSNSPAVRNMISTLRQNLTRNCNWDRQLRPYCGSSRNPSSGALCYRYVKMGLIGGGFMRTNPGGRHARGAGTELRRAGFRNLRDDPRFRNMTPEQAPIGAVLVYSGGSSGHIEVKAGQHEFLSDFRAAESINHRLPRTLIGVYIR
jgi:hypothetical protein